MDECVCLELARTLIRTGVVQWGFGVWGARGVVKGGGQCAAFVLL